MEQKYKFADRNQENLCIEQKNVPADVEKKESKLARLLFGSIMWDNKMEEQEKSRPHKNGKEGGMTGNREKHEIEEVRYRSRKKEQKTGCTCKGKF